MTWMLLGVEKGIMCLENLLFLTDNRLLVMARYIMELDSVIVEVVEDSKTELITLSVVRLGPGTCASSSVGPFNIVVTVS